MKDALWVLTEENAEKKVLVESTGRVVFPLAVDGYGCVRNSVCSQLVIGVPVDTLQTMQVFLKEVGGISSACPEACFLQIRPFITVSELEKVKQFYMKDFRDNNTNSNTNTNTTTNSNSNTNSNTTTNGSSNTNTNTTTNGNSNTNSNTTTNGNSNSVSVGVGVGVGVSVGKDKEKKGGEEGEGEKTSQHTQIGELHPIPEFPSNSVPACNCNDKSCCFCTIEKDSGSSNGNLNISTNTDIWKHIVKFMIKEKDS
ncbi:hypothetical protein NECID01_1086 [Nematocida sp. AWRm77]|nr:hypothetical protein NECID01_1086 [Nematocida sp. AWRm77]